MSVFAPNCFCEIRKEDVFRNADAQIIDPVVFPNIYEEFDPLPFAVQERENLHAGGKILPTNEYSKGYPMGVATPDLNLQTAVFWYYLLGKCTTVGTDTAITGRNVTYGGTGKVITIDGAALTVNAWIGYVLVVTGGDQINHYWYITANAANTITLEEADTNLPTNINADVVKIVGPPYTHTITMASVDESIPSFTMHAELQDWSLYYDFLGCIVTEITDSLKDGAAVMHAPTIESPYHIAGANRSLPSPQFHSETTARQLEWKQVNVFQVQYNSVNLDSVTDLRSWVDEITVHCKRTHKYVRKGGEYGFTDLLQTGFEFDCKFNYRAQGLQVITLADTLVSAYAGAISLSLQYYRSATDYITIALNKCKLSLPSGIHFPSKEESELILPVTLELAPDTTGAAVTVTAVDALSHKHYEDASE